MIRLLGSSYQVLVMRQLRRMNKPREVVRSAA
jgi:hypothetical protein